MCATVGYMINKSLSNKSLSSCVSVVRVGNALGPRVVVVIAAVSGEVGAFLPPVSSTLLLQDVTH